MPSAFTLAQLVGLAAALAGTYLLLGLAPTLVIGGAFVLVAATLGEWAATPTPPAPVEGGGR